MMTAASLLERAGLGGRVALYLKVVGVYFAVGHYKQTAEPAGPSHIEILSKCAPILCLILLLMLHKDRSPRRKRYRRLVAGGLALSAAGDALLVWSDLEHVVAGMAAFAAAHAVYVWALGWRGKRRPGVAFLFYTFGLGYTILVLNPSGPLRWLVPLYGLLLATMGWRAAARGGLAAAGGAVFVVSDALLGYDMFGGPLPHRTALVMTTYYLAQLLLALSAVIHN